MSSYPGPLVQVDHVEPVPRRIRARFESTTVVDTTAALYRWEVPFYPQYYIPVDDIDPQFLADRPDAVTVRAGLSTGGTEKFAHIEWSGVDAWFEEDEQVYVHPRSPYVRVDAIRSTRPISIAVDGVELAVSSSSVMVFETGLPTRYYLDPTEVHWQHLTPSETVTACPYKGVTTGYWSVRTGERTSEDLAWSYAYPTRQLLPIAGLVAFYNEKVDVTLDGEPVERPETHFS